VFQLAAVFPSVLALMYRSVPVLSLMFELVRESVRLWERPSPTGPLVRLSLLLKPALRRQYYKR
jgi:hypothetical protein